MALWVSSRPPSGSEASTAPFAGLMTSNVSPEAEDSIHSPPTKRFSIISVAIMGTSRFSSSYAVPLIRRSQALMRSSEGLGVSKLTTTKTRALAAMP
jgi:hypothetical protein